MASSSQILELFPSETLDQPWALKQSELMRSDLAPPAVLLLGSSRTDAGLVAEQLARELELAQADVVKLTRGGLTYWDALVALRRNPHLLDHAKIVAIDLAPWQFVEKEAPPNHFYWYATFGERLGVSWPETTRAMVDWAWPIVAQRRNLRSWTLGATAYLRALRNPPPPEPARNGYWDAHQQMVETKHRPDSGDFGPERFVTKAFQGAELSRTSIQQLSQLLDLLHERGATVILHEPPMRAQVYETIERSAAFKRKFAAYTELIRSRDAQDQQLLWLRVALSSDLGLTDDALLDYGHLGHQAAVAYTSRLAEFIQQHGLLDAPSTAVAGRTSHKAGM